MTARALRDAGMEVIYTGLRQTPEMVVEAALARGCGCHWPQHPFGAHMPLMARIMELMAENEMGRCRCLWAVSCLMKTCPLASDGRDGVSVRVPVSMT